MVWPKILGGGGALRIVFLLEKECRFSGADNYYLDSKQILNFVHLQAVGMQKLSNFPWLLNASAPYELPGETFIT